jgi:hypothetical protein
MFKPNFKFDGHLDAALKINISQQYIIKGKMNFNN